MWKKVCVDDEKFCIGDRIFNNLWPDMGDDKPGVGWEIVEIHPGSNRPVLVTIKSVGLSREREKQNYYPGNCFVWRREEPEENEYGEVCP